MSWMIQWDNLIRIFLNVLTDGIGTIKDSTVLIDLKNDQKIVFLKSRAVPFTLRKATVLEMERLTKEDI